MRRVIVAACEAILCVRVEFFFVHIKRHKNKTRRTQVSLARTQGHTLALRSPPGTQIFPGRNFLVYLGLN